MWLSDTLFRARCQLLKVQFHIFAQYSTVKSAAYLKLEYKKTVYYTEMHENFRQKTTKLMRRFPDIALASVRISLPEMGSS